MKFIRSKIYVLLLAVLSTIVIVSCEQFDGPNATPESPTLQGEGGLEGPGSFCNEGNTRQFLLVPIQPIAFETSADLAFTLETSSHPYTKDSCMCKVKNYDIIFDSLPPLPTEDSIEVTDKGGAEIAFRVVDDHEPYQAIRINRPEELDGANLDVYINWAPAGYDCSVVQAGGLCIIENLDADEDDILSTTQPYYEPYVRVAPPQSAGEDPTKTFFIPSSMTTASGN